MENCHSNALTKYSVVPTEILLFLMATAIGYDLAFDK